MSSTNQGPKASGARSATGKNGGGDLVKIAILLDPNTPVGATVLSFPVRSRSALIREALAFYVASNRIVPREQTPIQSSPRPHEPIPAQNKQEPIGGVAFSPTKRSPGRPKGALGVERGEGPAAPPGLVPSVDERRTVEGPPAERLEREHISATDTPDNEFGGLLRDIF